MTMHGEEVTAADDMEAVVGDTAMVVANDMVVSDMGVAVSDMAAGVLRAVGTAMTVADIVVGSIVGRVVRAMGGMVEAAVMLLDDTATATVTRVRVGGAARTMTTTPLPIPTTIGGEADILIAAVGHRVPRRRQTIETLTIVAVTVGVRLIAAVSGAMTPATLKAQPGALQRYNGYIF